MAAISRSRSKTCNLELGDRCRGGDGELTFQKSEKNPNWKGDKAGYTSLHHWVKCYFTKPPLCEICKSKKPYDLANRTRVYARAFDNWWWLCRRCHMLTDGRMFNLAQYHSDIERSLSSKKAHATRRRKRLELVKQ